MMQFAHNNYSMAQSDVCRLPKFLDFEYRQDQKLNTAFKIENVTDKIVSYKIKANRPELYLVKPMEGSIYKKDSIKITFIRKALSKQDFESYLHTPNPTPQEKFLIEFKSQDHDAIGREKTNTQTAYVTVRFRADYRSDEHQSSSLSQPSRKREEELKALNQKIKKRKEELEKLGSPDEWGEARRKKELSKLNMRDLIHLVMLAFLVGLAV